MADKFDDNFLDMDDDEFAKLGEPDFSSISGSEEEEGTDTNTEDVDPDKKTDEEKEEGEDLDEEEEEEEDSDSDDSDKDKDQEEDEDDPDADKDKNEDDSDPEKDKDKEKTEDDPDKEKKETPETFDYKANYEALMSTFKANGVEMTPKSIEDARSLMQMGANYHKKMSGMAPARQALKTLEINGLLDGDKLDLLIDASKGNPEAITRLLKEHNINPMDVDVTAESSYTPDNHTVSSREVELDTVLEEIKGTATYVKTIDTVTKQWDTASRQAAATSPQIIKVINEHMANGTFDAVMQAVEYDRSMGKLDGISDFEAYKLTGNRLQEEGSFNQQANPKEAEQEKVTPKKVDPDKEKMRQEKKRKASPSKSTPKKVGKLPKDFNPLDMSDEEFAKFDPKRLGL